MQSITMIPVFLGGGGLLSAFGNQVFISVRWTLVPIWYFHACIHVFICSFVGEYAAHHQSTV